MRKILLPWGGEMGIISLRCRVSAAPGGSVACCRRWGAGNTLPLPYYSVFIVIIPLVDRPCNPHRAIARGGKKFQFAWNRQECPTWTFLFFCAIRPPADDGLPYRELFFLHTKPLPVVPPDMRAGRRYAPLPCSLCVLALELGPCGLGISSSRPEDSGHGWVLWSSGFGAYAASGGRVMPSSSQVVSAKW